MKKKETSAVKYNTSCHYRGRRYNDVVDIFVNSASHSRDCSVQMYVGDLKIYTVIDTAEDVTHFQCHLDTLVTCSHKWQLHISSKTCNLLYSGAVDGPDMLIDGSVICKAHCVRDLGVLVDPDFKFMAHIVQHILEAT